jgi:surfactin synthase thioesterase subunit
MQAGFTLDEELTQDFVHHMIQELVSHHEIFRLRFTNDQNPVRVTVGSEPMVNIELLDGNTPDFREQLALYQDTLNHRIDLNEGPLAAILIVHSQGSTHLLCTIHHLVMDAMSLRLMRDQFQWMLDQHRKGDSIVLQSGYITQQQWTQRCSQITREAGFDSEREHWDSMFAAMTKNREAISASAQPRAQTRSISKDQTASILDLCKSTGQKLEHLLIASTAKAIAMVTGRQAITVGIESQGRESLGRTMDTGTTLGWFTTEFPVHLTCSCSLTDLVSDVTAQISGIQRDGLGAVLARNEWIERGQTPPKSDLGFNYLGEFDTITSVHSEWRWDDSLISTKSDFTHQWHPMELSALVENGSIQIRFQSNSPTTNQNELELILETIQESLMAMTQTAVQDNRPAIVFFPFVASNAGFFDKLKAQLESEFKIVVLELPGHGKRLDDPFVASLEEACNDLLEQIQRTVTRATPMFWVGHSMGAYVASACMNVLQKRQQQLPVGFLISDVAAPGQFDTWIVGDMTPAQRSEYYSRLGYDVLLEGLDEASKAHADQLIRQDLKLVRNFVDPNQPRIALPVHFLYSTTDSESIKDYWIAGWQSICDHTVESTAFEGGHIDWLENSQNSEVIKAWIRSIFQMV